jgi:hypothetical protein
MPICKNCKTTFDGVYRAKYCSINCRLERYKSPSESGCIEWSGTKMSNGYPVLRINGKTQLAHRLSYEEANGEIPDGLFACHKCDNRGCVNPGHIFIGTHEDNMRDMGMKKRSAWATRKMPDEVRKKIAATKKANAHPASEKQRAAASATMKNLWSDKEHREKMQKRMTGSSNPSSGPMSEERRARYKKYWDSMRKST